MDLLMCHGVSKMTEMLTTVRLMDNVNSQAGELRRIRKDMLDVMDNMQDACDHTPDESTVARYRTRCAALCTYQERVLGEIPPIDMTGTTIKGIGGSMTRQPLSVEEKGT
jgi:hypothetical protein